jgi:glutamate dehydrogenase
MTSTAGCTGAEALEEVLAILPAGDLSEWPAGMAQTFARLTFAGLSKDELTGWEPVELARLVRSGVGFVALRAAQAAKARVRPLEAGGRRLTVIEIITDDMPFLLDSVLGEIQGRGLTVKLVAHPIFLIARDGDGKLASLESAEGQEAILDVQTGGQERFIHIHTEGALSDEVCEELRRRLLAILAQVRSVVEDRRPMFERMAEAIGAMKRAAAPSEDEIEEAAAFLQWLLDGNFTFLGMREHAFVQRDKGQAREAIPGAGLGLLRDPERMAAQGPASLAESPPDARNFFFGSAPLLIAKTNFRSDVHRRVHADCIIIKLYAASGENTGELRVAGLFTASAYNFSMLQIPLLRRKAQWVIARSGHRPAGPSANALLNVLETFPRDELFQAPPELLACIASQVVRLSLTPRTRVFIRRDSFGRFISALVYVCRERFTTRLRQEICDYLADMCEGYVSEFTPFFAQGPLVRLQVVVWSKSGRMPEVSEAQLEAGVARMVRTWRDELQDQLDERFGPSAGPLAATYLDAFPASYEESNNPARAIEDILRLERLTPEAPIGIDLFRDDCFAPHRVRAALYQIGEPITLSRRVPIFENLGFSVIAEQTFRLAPKSAGDGQTIFLHDMILETGDGRPAELWGKDERLEDCFLAVWRGDAENDRCNGLIVKAGLNWREASLFRAYSAFLRQIGAPFSRGYLAATLNQHGAAVADLMELFRTFFDPRLTLSPKEREAGSAGLVQRFEARMEKVRSLDEDRVLRRFLNLIQATLRSNFYELQGGGPEPETIAFKLASGQVEHLPQPRPYAEIFVYSPRFEGVHLRRGKVARGGVRWSDRPQDFRTEILALAKAQQVKNTVIVPQGAKGGFALKFPPQTPAAVQAEGAACYQAFIESLLSLTDNYEDGEAAPLSPIIRRDDGDPYLVVAADKGTSRFSDLANSIALKRHFWLGDAFASGGSSGYDHKKMGVTARGAWETVKRHFREMNIDARTAPLKVIGVGDMSGDVFGNGMLLSQNLRLVAAFDHRDIFVDPHPDPAASLAERKRLFDLPKSSWQDYDRAVVSAGGGVFSRKAKSIPLTPEMQTLLDVREAALTPNQLIRAVLTASADLLWFGGVGAFVRASFETDAAARDRANDAIRVSADRLRVKVVGEGANLGMTQRARMEFAALGGRVNTDAIDNSAGVNCSDIEVNIKIALGAAVRRGALSPGERNALLADMTDEVALKCVRNNYLQSLAISMGEQRGVAELGFQLRLMRELEARGLLDRDLEALPNDARLASRIRREAPLTRPELAVLLAYAKMNLELDLDASPLPDDPCMARLLTTYFPSVLRKRFAREIERHQLRREIIVTALANDMINYGGATFVVRLAEETGSSAADVARAFTAARDIFELDRLFASVDALDNKIDGSRQLGLYVTLQNLLWRQTAWFARRGGAREGLAQIIERHRSGLRAVRAALFEDGDEATLNSIAQARSQLALDGVSGEVADEVAALEHLANSPDIVLIAQRLGRPERQAANCYFRLGACFRLNELRAMSERLVHNDYFDRLAVTSELGAMASAWRAVAMSVMEKDVMGPDGLGGDLDAWIAGNERWVHVKRGIDEILDSGSVTLPKLAVAVAHLRDLAHD